MLMIISCAAIVLLAGLTAYNVIMRYVFSKPVTGATEWSQMLLIIAMLAMGIAIADGRSIRVGMIVDHFPKKLNIAFELIMGLLAFAFFALVGWMLIDRIGWLIERKKAYLYLGWPEWPLYGALGIAFLSSAVGTAVCVIKNIINFKSAKEKDIFDENPDLAAITETYEFTAPEDGNDTKNIEVG